LGLLFGFGGTAYIRSDGVLSYEIRFENQPNATAPAQRVVVTDTMDPSLDSDTFELVAVAFADQTVTFPPGLKEYAGQQAFRFDGSEILADIHAELDRTTRTLQVMIQGIDPATGWALDDPLTGLLAPGGRTFVVEWSATDDVAGSGLAGVDLYASSDGTNYVRVFEGGDASITGAEVTVETAGTYWFYSIARDHVGHEEPAPTQPDAEVIVVDAVAATVTARHVFYNRSAWDGQDAGATVSDDSAIAVDKSPLLPGQTAAFGHYTSSSRGLNGVMVDIAGLAGTPTAADFTFRVGNSNTPDSWGPAPSPSSVTVRTGAGIDGSDRVTLIWPDNAIQKQWLQVTVLATANTGLAIPDVFYFGNAIGDTGDSAVNAQVNVLDEAAIRAHPRNFLSPAPIDWAWDINRDRNVNVQDEAIARAHSTSFLNALKLITVPAVSTDANALLAQNQRSFTPAAKSTADSRSSALRMQGGVPGLTTSQDPVRSSLGDGSADRQAIGTLGFVSVRRLDANRLTIEVPWSGGPTGVLETAESIGPGDDAWKEVEVQGDPVESGVLRWTVPIQRTRPHQYFRIRQNPNPQR